MSLIAARADATLIMTLDDLSGHQQTITDNDSNDLLADGGAIAWVGSLGVWSLNVSTGISDSPAPFMDLNTVNMSTRAGTLRITLTDDGFSSLGGNVLATIGGTSNGKGSILFNTSVDNTSLTSILSSSSPFAGTAGATFIPSGPYSLTIETTIVHTIAGLTSFDANLTVPEPATISLLGAGLIILGFSARARQSKRA